MTQCTDTSLVGIDWGTTHRRIYALNSAGVCTQNWADDQGALACRGRFASALDAALQRLSIAPERVVMSGMVGSAFGWQEVPYVDADVLLAELPCHAVRVEESVNTVQRVIVPGYCIRNAQGQPDVMRGEETQLLGAWALGYQSGWFVLPGTHSKWVELQAGRIVQLRTYMTGELFETLGKHGTLAVAAGQVSQVWDEDAFAQGVRSAGYNSLSQQLFGCRARVVCGDMPAGSVKAYLSGLLIGAEMHDVLRTSNESVRAKPVYFIGAMDLAKHYLAVAGILQLQLEVMDAQAAYVAALTHFKTYWGNA
jgi:2-dehydro-3-deoxygalactonokinase